jgi:hypothetical protein
MWRSTRRSAQSSPTADATPGSSRRALDSSSTSADEDREGGQEALRATALVGNLRGDLLPPGARCPEQHVVGDEDVVQDDLVEVVLAVEQPDRVHGQAGARRQVDDELARLSPACRSLVSTGAVRHRAIM